MFNTFHNVYYFKVLFANGTRGMRNIPQNTYNNALNDLYFPGPDFDHLPAVNEAQLIGIQKDGVHLGDNALQSPETSDFQSA